MEENKNKSRLLEKFKEITTKRTLTTRQAEAILMIKSKGQLAKELGITRPTLDSRLAGTTKWKILERNWIARK